jgi:betaine-aldehyde dehydrogenase
VLAVQKFSGEDEAVKLAKRNGLRFGGRRLHAGRRQGAALHRRLRAGITWINSYHPTYNEAPWGGYKQSGIGRELGTFGFDAYTEIKQININMAVQPVGWFAE